MSHCVVVSGEVQESVLTSTKHSSSEEGGELGAGEGAGDGPADGVEERLRFFDTRLKQFDRLVSGDLVR